MADDTPKPPSKQTIEGTEKLTDATEKQADAFHAVTQSARPATQSLNAWNIATQAAIRNQETLADTIQKETEAIKQQAQEMSSLNMQVRDLSGSFQGFMGTMKRQMTISHQYNRALKHIQEGQKAYTSSIQASTSELGKASAQSQKHVDALNDAYIQARKTAGEYTVDAEKLKAHTTELHAAFAGQLGMMGDVRGELLKLQKSSFIFSKFMGVDYSESVRYMNERFMNSTKTIDEVRQETIMVAKAADDYSNKLKTLGKRAQQSGSMTREGFLNVIKQIQQEFKGGMFAAEGFAKSTVNLSIAAKKAGMTGKEQEQLAVGFGKMLKNLGSFQSVFGVKVAQRLGEMLKNVDQIQDERLKKRLMPYAKQAEEGRLNIMDLSALISASEGSNEGLAMLSGILGDLGKKNPEILRVLAAESSGQNQYLADLLANQLKSGEIEENFRKQAAKESKGGKDKRKKEVMTAEKSMAALVKQGHTSTRARDKIIRAVERFRQEAMAMINKYFPLFVAAQALGSLRGLRGGAGGVPGAAGRATGAAGRAAGAVGRGGRLARAGGALQRGVGRIRGAAGGSFLGAAGAAYGGYELSQQILHSTWLSEQLKKGGGVQTGGAQTDLQKQLAQAKNVQQMSYAMFFHAMGKKYFKPTEKAITDSDRKRHKDAIIRIKQARARWDKLSPAKKKEIKKLEDSNFELGQRIEKADEKRDKAREKWGAKRAKYAQENMVSRAKRLDVAKLGAEKSVEKLVTQMRMGGKLVERPSEVISGFLSTKEGRQFVAKSGKSEEEIKRMMMERVVDLRARQSLVLDKASAEKYHKRQQGKDPETMRRMAIMERYKEHQAGRIKMDPALVTATEEMMERWREEALKSNELSVNIKHDDKPAEASKLTADGKIRAYVTGSWIDIDTKHVSQGSDQYKMRNTPGKRSAR